MSLTDLIPFLQQYPSWVRYLFALIVLLVCVLVVVLVFARTEQPRESPTGSAGPITRDRASSPPASTSPYADPYAEFLGDLDNAFLIASAVQGESFFHPTRQQTVFSSFMADGLAGAADGDRDGRITIRELELFLFESIEAYSRTALLRGLEPPIFINRGDVETVLVGSRVPFENAIGLLIGIGDYDDGASFSSGGAARIMDLLGVKVGLSATRLLGPDAVQAKVHAALKELPARTSGQDLLVIAFAGFVHITHERKARWLLYSPNGDDYVDATLMADILKQSPAKYKLVIMDCSVGGEFYRRRKLASFK